MCILAYTRDDLCQKVETIFKIICYYCWDLDLREGGVGGDLKFDTPVVLMTSVDITPQAYGYHTDVQKDPYRLFFFS